MRKPWLSEFDFSMLAIPANVLTVRAGDKRIHKFLFHPERFKILANIKLDKNSKRFNQILARMVEIAEELYVVNKSGGTVGVHNDVLIKYVNQTKNHGPKNPTEWFAVHAILWGYYNRNGVTGRIPGKGPLTKY